jgi:hypothetical protein
MGDLADYTTPIRSGLESATGGVLNADRARRLGQGIEALRAARLRAAVEIRSYPVGSRDDAIPAADPSPVRRKVDVRVPLLDAPVETP